MMKIIVVRVFLHLIVYKYYLIFQVLLEFPRELHTRDILRAYVHLSKDRNPNDIPRLNELSERYDVTPLDDRSSAENSMNDDEYHPYQIVNNPESVNLPSNHNLNNQTNLPQPLSRNGSDVSETF